MIILDPPNDGVCSPSKHEVTDLWCVGKAMKSLLKNLLFVHAELIARQVYMSARVPASFATTALITKRSAPIKGTTTLGTSVPFRVAARCASILFDVARRGSLLPLAAALQFPRRACELPHEPIRIFARMRLS